MSRVQITYVASSGNRYDLISNGIRHKEANYYKWRWNVEGTKLKYGMRVADFSRDPGEYDTELIFYGSLAKRKALLNALHDDFENDVRKKSPGRFIVGDWYLDAFVIESVTEPTETWSWTSNTIGLYAPHPFWMQEVRLSLPVSEVGSGEFLDFPYDYPYDFTDPVMGTRRISTDFPFSSEFKMVIYGLAVNPRIVINGYAYVLYTTIPQGSYVVIDSRARTVMMYGSNGAETNIFDYRNKTASVFEKVPGGNLEIVWDATFGVDLTIYHERLEPRIEV